VCSKKGGNKQPHFVVQKITGGFGSFTYSHSQLTDVINYIKNQGEHHKKKSFKEEYLELLRKFDIEYNERYHSPQRHRYHRDSQRLFFW